MLRVGVFVTNVVGLVRLCAKLYMAISCIITGHMTDSFWLIGSRVAGFFCKNSPTLSTDVAGLSICDKVLSIFIKN